MLCTQHHIGAFVIRKAVRTVIDSTPTKLNNGASLKQEIKTHITKKVLKENTRKSSCIQFIIVLQPTLLQLKSVLRIQIY